MGGRMFFDCLVRGRRPDATAFIPLLEELAPRLDGRTLEELTADPSLWANSIERLTKLVDADAVAIGWDISVLAEACGVPMRWQDDRPLLGEAAPSFNAGAGSAARMPAFLEAVRRLSATSRSERGCVIAMPGPATLASRIFGVADKQSLDALKPALVETAESICRARPDVLVLAERGQSLQGTVSPELRRACATLKNVADYYGVATALYVEGYDEVAAAAERLTVLRIEHLMVGADRHQRVPDPGEVFRAASRWRSVAAPVAPDHPEQARRSVEAALAAASRSGSAGPLLYFTTAGPVTRKGDIGALRELSAAIKAAGHGAGRRL